MGVPNHNSLGMHRRGIETHAGSKKKNSPKGTHHDQLMEGGSIGERRKDKETCHIESLQSKLLKDRIALKLQECQENVTGN